MIGAGPRLAVALVLLSAGCSGVGGGGTADRYGAVPVRMVDDAFSPKVVRVPAGTALLFANKGRNLHNAIAVDGSFSTIATAGGAGIKPGSGVKVRTTARAGVVRFYCTFHGHRDGAGMSGVVVVGEVPGAEVDAALGVRRATPVAAASGVVRRIPEQYRTIQAAVDDAQPGDLVLAAPGVYHEAVEVHTPSLTIRGADRNGVVLDGEFSRANGVAVYEADGVAVENLTARNYQLNGFFWTGVAGFRADHLTAVNNADYGIYAYDSTDGVIVHSYASGSPDAGVYVGQCRPCRVIVYDVVAEHNSVGYSGANAGGELFVVSSVWRRNRAGIAAASVDNELGPPQRDVTIAANLVVDNNSDAASKPAGRRAQGIGILIAGGRSDVVARNVVFDHASAGIAVAPFPDRHNWLAQANAVWGNTVAGSGLGDLVLVGPSGGGNCFTGNRFRVSQPPGLQSLNHCGGGLSVPLGWDLSSTSLLLARQATKYPAVTYADVARGPQPPPQPPLPGGASAPVRPALRAFAELGEVDVTALGSLPLPSAAAALVPRRSSHLTMSGIELSAPGGWRLLFGLYAYLLPFALLAAWMSVAFWDIARRDDLGKRAAVGWVAAILLVPFLGVIAYHVAGSGLPRWLRLTFVLGGAVSYVAIVGVAAAVGGVI